MLINYERLGIRFLTYFQFGHTCCERTYSESVSQYQARNAIPEDGNLIKERGENQRIKRSFIFYCFSIQPHVTRGRNVPFGSRKKQGIQKLG